MLAVNTWKSLAQSLNILQKLHRKITNIQSIIRKENFASWKKCYSFLQSNVRKSQFQDDYTLDQIMNSPKVCFNYYPLRKKLFDFQLQ